jgi:hypothetical protein
MDGVETMIIPKWMKKAHEDVLIGFKQQGARGNIGDVRRLAKKNAGDPIAQAFLKHGLMRGGGGSDFYELTPEGYEMATAIQKKRAFV